MEPRYEIQAWTQTGWQPTMRFSTKRVAKEACGMGSRVVDIETGVEIKNRVGE